MVASANPSRIVPMAESSLASPTYRADASGVRGSVTRIGQASGAGIFFVKGLRRHAPIFFCSPEKSSANASESFKQIRNASERSA